MTNRVLTNLHYFIRVNLYSQARNKPLQAVDSDLLTSTSSATAGSSGLLADQQAQLDFNDNPLLCPLDLGRKVLLKDFRLQFSVFHCYTPNENEAIVCYLLHILNFSLFLSCDLSNHLKLLLHQN